MILSRLMNVWTLLALVLAVSVVVPVYGTGSDQEPSTSMSQADNVDKSKTATDHTEATASSEDTTESKATSPELKLVDKLQARLQQLQEREQRLQDDEQRLGALRRDLEQMAARQEKAIAEAMAIRDAQQSAEKIDESQESLKHLIKVYEAMDPDEAALRISAMKESLALDILAGIKDKKAAGMLAGVAPAKAAKLTEGLRHYHKRKKKIP